jgi:hypothetical protein
MCKISTIKLAANKSYGQKWATRGTLGGVIGNCLFMIFPGKPFKHTLSSSVMLTTKHFNVAYSSYSLMFARNSKLIHM